MNISKFILGEKISTKDPIDNHDDSNDSDVQFVDSDTETVNDKLTQKLQRLHLDDRVNVPDESGRCEADKSSRTEDTLILCILNMKFIKSTVISFKNKTNFFNCTIRNKAYDREY